MWSILTNDYRIMSEILQVIEPFFVLEVGDTLQLSADGKQYVYENNSEYEMSNANNLNHKSTYSSTFTISVDMAKDLIEQGLLSEVIAKPKFVNVFDVIEQLLEQYTNELNNIDEEMKDLPACVKVEKTTVLQNMIKLLNHLKSLKK